MGFSQLCSPLWALPGQHPGGAGKGAPLAMLMLLPTISRIIHLGSGSFRWAERKSRSRCRRAGRVTCEGSASLATAGPYMRSGQSQRILRQVFIGFGSDPLARKSYLDRLERGKFRAWWSRRGRGRLLSQGGPGRIEPEAFSKLIPRTAAVRSCRLERLPAAADREG